MEQLFYVMLMIGSLFGFFITKHTKYAITTILIFFAGCIAAYFAGYNITPLIMAYEGSMSDGLGLTIGIFIGYFLAYKAPADWWGNKPKK